MNSFEHNSSASQNNEEPIFLASSDEEETNQGSSYALGYPSDFSASTRPPRYDAYEEDDDEEFENTSEDNYAYMDEEDAHNSSLNRRPIKVYDEYDPENIDNTEEDNIFDGDSLINPKKLISQSDDETGSSTSLVSDDSLPSKKVKESEKPVAEMPAKKMKLEQKKSEKSVSNPKKSSPVSDRKSVKESGETIKKTKTENIKKDESKVKTLSSPAASKPATKPSTAPILNVTDAKGSNMISGKIINLSSGFKIPKRPSQESASPSEPPEKKTKTSVEKDKEEKSEKPKTQLTNTAKKTDATPTAKAHTKTDNTKKHKEEDSSAKKSTSQNDSKHSSKTSSNQKTSPAASSSTKTSKTDKKDKKNEKHSSTTTQPIPVVNKPASAPIVKPKPAKTEFQESDAFMDALSSKSSRHSKPAHVTKPKIISKFADDLSTDTKHSKPTVDPSANGHSNHHNSESSPLNTIVDSASDKSLVTVAGGVSGELKSNVSDSVLNKKGGNKKRVVWADSCSKQLEQVQFFYLDESERDIKKTALMQKGVDMSKYEKMSEKEMRFKLTHSYGFSNTFDQTSEAEQAASAAAAAANSWFLIPIDLPEHSAAREIRSSEKEIQAKREQSTLQCFLTKEYLPETPGEPLDLNNNNDSELVKTKLIPLEEVTTNNLDLSVHETEYHSHQQTNNKKEPLLSAHSPTSDFYDNSSEQENRFYNPTKSLQSREQDVVAAASTTNTITNAATIPNPVYALDTSKLANIASLSSSLLKSDLEADNLKKILNNLLNSNSGNSIVDPTSNLVAASATDIDIRQIGSTTTTTTTSNVQDTPISPTLTKEERPRSGSRWGQETNSNWSNNTYNNNNNNSTSNTNNTQKPPYYKANSYESSAEPSGRNVFSNNFKRGIGNRPSSNTSDNFRSNNYSNSFSNSNRGYDRGGYGNNNSNSSSNSNRNYSNNNYNNRYDRNRPYTSSSSSSSSRRDESDRDNRSPPEKTTTTATISTAGTGGSWI